MDLLEGKRRGRVSSDKPLALSIRKGRGRASSDDSLAAPEGKCQVMTNLPFLKEKASGGRMVTTPGVKERKSGDDPTAILKGKRHGRESVATPWPLQKGRARGG